MPPQYAVPNHAAKKGETYLRVFVGPNTPFNLEHLKPGTGPRMVDFTDGTRPGRRGDCSPRLPQIRTCPIKAYGSSGHGLAAHGTAAAIRWCVVDTEPGF